MSAREARKALSSSCVNFATNAKLWQMLRAAIPSCHAMSNSAFAGAPFGNFLIFYRVGIQTIEVVHVLHGARDYEPLLFPEK